MFNLPEYVGRIKRIIAEKRLETVQEIELKKYEITAPHIYTLGTLFRIYNEYDADSEKCRKCPGYLVCGSVVNSLKSGDLEAVAITKSPISMN